VNARVKLAVQAMHYFAYVAGRRRQWITDRHPGVPLFIINFPADDEVYPRSLDMQQVISKLDAASWWKILMKVTKTSDIQALGSIVAQLLSRFMKLVLMKVQSKN